MLRNLLSTVLTHAAGWLFFLCLPWIFLVRAFHAKNYLSFLFSSPFWLFASVYFVVFYFTSYFLIPRLYFKRKYTLYLFSILLLFIAVFYLSPFDRLMRETRRFQVQQMGVKDHQGRNSANAFRYPNRPFEGIDIVSIYLFLSIVAFSMAMQVMKRWRLTEKRAVLAEADKANAELSFLKAQINPHFLFNTLNNIYTLAVTRNENTPECIMKLSNIMRYITDDAGKDFVQVEDEIKFITDYVDLQKLRLGKKAQLTYSVSGELKNKAIAPLLLISFIENVFEHGVSKHEYSPIVIQIHASDEAISFQSENKIFKKNKRIERTSIGVANSMQRLKYLYPDKHALKINAENGQYDVSLVLQL